MKVDLHAQLREQLQEKLPFPGSGHTRVRHRRLMAIGREDLCLARLAEAHYDAVAILAEAGREALPNAIYGVWASDRPGQELVLTEDATYEFRINGRKMFCSGAGVIDHALITVGGPAPLLVDFDLRTNQHRLTFDHSGWKTTAFRETQTATVTFDDARASQGDVVGEPGWYLDRPGFWHGACGPAACWAGGAAGLLDYALRQPRRDPHTLAHLGAMYASLWAAGTFLDSAADEIDANVSDGERALVRALTVRHLVEGACSDVLRRLPRAYGPHPLAMDEEIGRRVQELELYLRQCHAERDLEFLARGVLDLQRSVVDRSPAGCDERKVADEKTAISDL